MLRKLGLMVVLSVPGTVIAQEADMLTGHGGAILDIAVSEDGRIATASFDNSIGLWDHTAPTWLEGHDAAVTVVRFLSDGSLVSAGDDFALLHWRDRTPLLLGRHRGKITDISEAPDGTLATASWDGAIGLWRDDEAPGWLVGHESGVNAVEFADDSALVSAGADGTVRIWDLASGSDRVVYRHGFGINVMASVRDWTAIGTVDGRVLVLDSRTWSERATYEPGRDPVVAMAISPDGSRIAIGNGAGRISVISIPDALPDIDFMSTSYGPVWALAFDGNARLLAGGLDHRVFFQPLDSGSLPARTADPSPPVTPVDNGELQFQRKCSVCHTLSNDGQRRAGPALGGLFGRQAGSVPGYRYSDTLAGSKIVWDSETINELFAQGPEHYVPGSRMPMQRITGTQDRLDLVKWLKSATSLSEE